MAAPILLLCHSVAVSYRWTENALWLSRVAHVSLHTLAFVTENEGLPRCHCQPPIQIPLLISHLPTWSQLLHLCMCGCLYWLLLRGCSVAQGCVLIFTAFKSRCMLTFWGFCCVYESLCFRLCVNSHRTGAAPLVCSNAGKTRLHVMMTFVPVCLGCYSSVWRCWWPTFSLPFFPPAHDKGWGGVFGK